MNKASLNNKRELMQQDIEKLFKRILKNRETLIVSLVEEDLNKLHLEIQRTIQRMGL